MATAFKAFLIRLFGSSEREQQAPPAVEPTEYKGYLITPAPYPAKGQFQTAGVIEKEFGADRKQHRFVRAETHPTLADAVTFSLAKGKQIVDEQGDRIFN